MTDEIAVASCDATTCATVPSVERARDLAAQFNQSCLCITLDRNAMAGAMEIAAGDPAFYDTHILSRPHLFSNVPVFLPEADRDAMLVIVQAIEATTRSSGFREAVLASAPENSRHLFRPSIPRPSPTFSTSFEL